MGFAINKSVLAYERATEEFRNFNNSNTELFASEKVFKEKRAMLQANVAVTSLNRSVNK